MTDKPPEVDGPLEADARFPVVWWVAEWVLAALLTLVLVSGIGQNSANPVDVVLLLAAVIFLLVHPLRARTRVFTDRVEVTTFFGHRVAARAEVRGVRGGLIGPVLELADGTRIRTTAPIPSPSWLKNTREG